MKIDEKGNRLKSYAAPATVRLTTSQNTTVSYLTWEGVMTNDI